jgi:hypothetical protein
MTLSLDKLVAKVLESDHGQADQSYSHGECCMGAYN